MAKEFPCIETTVDFKLNNYIVRLWINKEEIPLEYFDEMAIKTKIHDYFDREIMVNQASLKDGLGNLQPPHRVMLLRFIAKISGVNAVQIQEEAKDGSIKYGTVVYTVDFSEDVHG